MSAKSHAAHRPTFIKAASATVFVAVGVAPLTVSVSGRLYTSTGSGASNARIVLSGPSTELVAITNAFGYYQFNNVTVGQTYTVSVVSKRFIAAPRVITVNDYMTEVDLVASP